jgi:hypothetical protein
MPPERRLTEPTARQATIAALHVEHAQYAAALHAAVLDRSFFARLGTPFLADHYRAFAASPHSIAFIAFDAGRPVGVVVGTTGNRAHYRSVLRHQDRRLGVRATGPLLRHPSRGIRSLRACGPTHLRGFASPRSSVGTDLTAAFLRTAAEGTAA